MEIFPLVSGFEILVGILLMTNNFSGLGALTLLPILGGILLTYVFTTPSGIPLAAVLFTINLWLIYENKEKYARMVGGFII